MEIKFFFGNITGRGEEAGIKFEFDESLIEQVKTSLNKYRYSFKMKTNRDTWQAGGWLSEKRLWYVALEIWLPFKEDLSALGHQFTQMSEQESSKYGKSESKSDTNSNSGTNSNWQSHSQSNQSNSGTKEQAKEESKNNNSQNKESKEENSNKSSKRKRKNSTDENNSNSKSRSSNNRRNQYNKPPTKGNFLEKEYEILGVSSNVSRSELKQAYRDLVEVWHPDRFTHNERLRLKAEEMLKRINSAYDRIKAVA